MKIKSDSIAYFFTKLVMVVFFGWLCYRAALTFWENSKKQGFPDIASIFFFIIALAIVVMTLNNNFREEKKQSYKTSKRNWRNISSNLCRQRVIVEATVETFVNDPEVIADYLQKLTEVVGMIPCRKPIVYTAHEDGWGAWQHWKSSGATFYSYPSRNGDPALITLDCYTCKPFVVEKVVKFTESYFKTKEIVWKEVTK